MKASPLILTVVLLAVLLASPVYLHLGNNQMKTVGSRTYWEAIASTAWEYFQPGKGVDATTGLHMASIGWPHFTEWDLGVYIQAIIDARKIGILSLDGPWGADARLEKVLSFLENREISPDGLPYWWYNSDTGLPWGDGAGEVYDAGKLLVALGNLELFRPDLAGRVNHLVYERYNYSSLWERVEGWASFPGIYEYYLARGFASFWPEKFSNVSELILDNFFSAPTVETPEGVKLPVSQIIGDPLLHSVFELKTNLRVLELAKLFYLAHEARYNATGNYVAFGEGNSGLDVPSYIFEWAVRDNHTWVIDDRDSDVENFSSVAYLKVAVSFLALYNTEFAKNMVADLELKLSTSNGYMDGIDEKGRVVSTVVDKTNGLIIGAARYAIENDNFADFPWHNGDLSAFPWPFVQEGTANNITMVIGEGKPNDHVDSAPATDAIGAILLTERLARESSNGSIKAELDSWVVNYDSNSGNITLLDNRTNLILVGSPRVNSLTYYYNNLKDRFGEPLVPVQFITNSADGYDYLYIPSSGSIYKLVFDKQNNLVADYGVIIAFQDQFGRNVAMVYGLSADGTLAACQVLSDYDHWNMRGSAVVIKSFPDKLANLPTNSSIIEVIY